MKEKVCQVIILILVPCWQNIEHSCTHIVTISAQRKVMAVTLLLHHRWECTFPDLCPSVGTQSICADEKLGWEDLCQTAQQARRQHNEQKPTRENETWFSVLRYFHYALVPLSCEAAMPLGLSSILRCWQLLDYTGWITGASETQLKLHLLKGKTLVLLQTLDLLKNIISIHFDNKGCTCPVEVPIFIHQNENIKSAFPLT